MIIENDTIFFPKELMSVKYNGKIIPNGKTHNLLETGANCQVFAYHILRLNGFKVPDFRSSELWSDTEYSMVVNSDLQPLDILFFNKNENPFGAHLAVYIGSNKAIHLAKHIGKPVIWTIEAFLELEKYPPRFRGKQVLIGGKRFYK